MLGHFLARVFLEEMAGSLDRERGATLRKIDRKWASAGAVMASSEPQGKRTGKSRVLRTSMATRLS